MYRDTFFLHDASSSPNRDGPRPLHSGPHGKSELHWLVQDRWCRDAATDFASMSDAFALVLWLKEGGAVPFDAQHRNDNRMRGRHFGLKKASSVVPKDTFSSPVCLIVLMFDAAATWKAEFHTCLLQGESGAHTDCNDFFAHQGVLCLRFYSGWSCRFLSLCKRAWMAPGCSH